MAVYEVEAEAAFSGWIHIVDAEVAKATPSAFESIGLSEVAQMVREVLSPFGEAGPRPDRHARIGQMDTFDKNVFARWSALDMEYSQYEESVEKLSIEYARAHLSEIRGFQEASDQPSPESPSPTDSSDS